MKNEWVSELPHTLHLHHNGLAQCRHERCCHWEIPAAIYKRGRAAEHP